MLSIKNKLTNKNAKIIFIDNKSYNKFYKNKSEIKKLKYNCGNNNITHYIQYDDFVFRLSTQYKHPPKINGIEEHINEIIYSAQYAKDNLGKIIENQITRIKNWKNHIDNIPTNPTYEKVSNKPQKQSIGMKILNKIKNFFFQ